LAVVPVLAVVALADHEVDVVGKLLVVQVVKAPLPVVVAVAELRGATVRDADLPELAAVAHRLPLQGAEGVRLPGGDRDAGKAELAQHAVGDGTQRVRAGPGPGNREPS